MKRFTDEQKKEIVGRAGKGEAVSDLAAEYGFHPTSFSDWKKKFGKKTQKVKRKTAKKPNISPKVVRLNERMIYFEEGVYKKIAE